MPGNIDAVKTQPSVDEDDECCSAHIKNLGNIANYYPLLVPGAPPLFSAVERCSHLHSLTTTAQATGSDPMTWTSRRTWVPLLSSI